MNHFLDPSKTFPHCPGCGHPHILKALDGALQNLSFPKEKVVLVTDIGCVGLADSLFPSTHTVHTLHGRSTAIASGLRMGEMGRAEPPIKPIVLIGDGGLGIGLLHVIHAAQMNVDVTVLVHNNLIYGMTGGQHSVLTPPGLKTTTTPQGCPIPPLDLGSVLLGAGATFFAREMAPGNSLVSVLAKALQHPGFACVEILELCPSFATRLGGVTGKSLHEIPTQQGLKMGILKQEISRPVFPVSTPPSPSPNLQKESSSNLISPHPSWKGSISQLQFVLAGKAGERVQSAALLAASAGCFAGFHVSVRTDNPVTQGSGFSLAELILSSEPIEYTGLENPDMVLATSSEGFQELTSRGFFQKKSLAKKQIVDLELSIAEGIGAEKRDLRKKYGPKNAALGGLMEEIFHLSAWKVESWKAAIQQLPVSKQEENFLTLSKVTGETI